MTDDAIVEHVLQSISDSEGKGAEFSVKFADWAQFGRVMARLTLLGIYVDSTGEIRVQNKAEAS